MSTSYSLLLEDNANCLTRDSVQRVKRLAGMDKDIQNSSWSGVSKFFCEYTNDKRWSSLKYHFGKINYFDIGDFLGRKNKGANPVDTFDFSRLEKILEDELRPSIEYVKNFCDEFQKTFVFNNQHLTNEGVQS